MCFPKKDRMDLTQSIAQKLQCMTQRQKCFINKQSLKELSNDDFRQYMEIRSGCLAFIRLSHKQFRTGSDTFVAAVNILDVFLWKVKVTPKHASIVSAACFFLAAKLFESSDDHPSARKLARIYQWSPKDLCRMESRILSKLDWSVVSVSHLDFFSVFADIYGLDVNIYNDRATELAYRCLADQSTVLLEPAVLALSLIHHLKTKHDRLPAEQQLLVYCNIQENDLKQCMESLSAIAALAPFCASQIKPKLPMRLFDKPSQLGTTCLYTIEE